jgi:hypothetical protein
MLLFRGSVTFEIEGKQSPEVLDLPRECSEALCGVSGSMYAEKDGSFRTSPKD